MARIDKTYLDWDELQLYDSKIKEYVDQGGGEGVKADEITLTLNTTTHKMSIKNPPKVVGSVLYL